MFVTVVQPTMRAFGVAVGCQEANIAARPWRSAMFVTVVQPTMRAFGVAVGCQEANIAARPPA
jgi:hypothetical protein